ncbi:hypothetical protein [Micropruina glycogenica]|uniref:Uncharacterized protein n=1 Tax=Micropruina glycogenica TaxID=75385 RepID=A0A2N9JD87_9ACTN|nr:hypothetical protein [Micropruina glycogenica]SPD85520.1 protein of unknown function [Micropruina glycogenica]
MSICGPYDHARWLDCAAGLPRAERIVAKYMHDRADQSGLVTGLSTNALRNDAAGLRLTRDDAARAFQALRRQHRLYDIASEAAHHDGVPRTYQLRTNSSPVVTRQVEPMPMHRPGANVPKYRANKLGILELVEDGSADGTEDEYDDHSRNASRDDDAAA